VKIDEVLAGREDPVAGDRADLHELWAASPKLTWSNCRSKTRSALATPDCSVFYIEATWFTGD